MSWVSRMDLYDGLFVIGIVCLEIGVAQWSSPAAWVLGGLVLVGLALAPLRRRREG